MSLDVYLKGPITEHDCWHCNGKGIIKERDEYFSANITHNLSKMAEAAGISKHLWSPEELGITKAGQLVAPLQEGVHLMKESPAKFEALNPSNGWGNYWDFVPWIERYIEACKEYPDADIDISR